MSPWLNDSPSSSAAISTPSLPHDDPAVIVGMACRVPGASSPSELWKLLEQQRDVQQKIPANRFNVDEFYHPDGANKGTTNARYGYFLEQDLGTFDPGFFNISGNEAEAMDPQQRILLEVVYEALENAGIPLEKISGSQTSVFCGSFTNDYNSMITKDLEYYPKYTITGTGNSILSNRISYFYNLHGASATIDTACSSSIVCFHLGQQTLQSGEASMSIILGSALHFDPNVFITMTDLGMLSTDGRCRAFDAAGSGYVRGEGICAIILKRKSQAEIDGDTIRAIVRGTGVNHDGTKQGITLPSSESQEALIRQVYKTAGLDPKDTNYFEAHGTGTRAGDPRETRAIGAVFAPRRDGHLHIGSVKSNIGHLEGASGVAALIKATLCLEKKKILPNMHFNTPNPNIKFDEWKLTVPTKIIDWVATNELRRASVNSFGYGGTNGHVILEGYYEPPSGHPLKVQLPSNLEAMTKGRPFLFPLTSHSVNTGKLTGEAFSTYVEERPELEIRDLAYSLSVRRSMHKFRSFAVSSDGDSLLGDFADPPPVAAWTAALPEKVRIGFVFTGQGGQWFAMGRELIQKSPLFKQTLQRCDNILSQLPDAPEWSVVDELLKSEATSRLAETQFSQPLCTALQLAICTLLAQWGIEPAAVVGHSSGEIGAAYAAGILSFENAMITAYYRGLYMSNSPDDRITGAMMAVGLTEEQARAEIKPYTGRIVVAAINSPSSITLSGDKDAILELEKELKERKVFARQLHVSQAFHSHHMFPLATGYLQALEKYTKFTTLPAKCRMFSSVTGKPAQPSLMGPQYWVENMVGTVRFSDALGGILFDNGRKAVDVLMEIGPHPALKGPTRQILKSFELEIPYLSSLNRGTLDFESLLTAVGQIFALGYPVDLGAANSDHFLDESGDVHEVNNARRLRDMPKYCWDHTARYWAGTRVVHEHMLRRYRHSILGVPVTASMPSCPRWRNFLRLSELPWLADHRIDGNVVFPAAGYISMAVEAITRLENGPASIAHFAFRDISIKSALVLDESAMGKEVMLELRPKSTLIKPAPDTWYEFSIVSFGNSTAESTEHCHGLISVQGGLARSIERKPPFLSFSELQAKSFQSLIPGTFYERIQSQGLQYGKSFALLSERIEIGPGFATAPLLWKWQQFNSPVPNHVTLIHPSLLDASLHTIFAAIEGRTGKPIMGPFVPTFFRSLDLSGIFAKKDFLTADHVFRVATEVELQGNRIVMSDLRLESDNGQQLLCEIQGLELTGLGSDDIASRPLFFRTKWRPAFEFLGGSHAAISGTLVDLVDSFVHQFPNSKILHMTAVAESAKVILQLLDGQEDSQRRFNSLTLPPMVEEVPSSIKQLQAEWPSLIKLEEPREGEYDLLILEDDSPQNHNLAKYLKAEGFVISGSHITNVSKDSLTPVFNTGRFNAWKKIDAPCSLIAGADLALITTTNPSDRVVSIASKIASIHQGNCLQMSLDQFCQTNPAPENVVILAALDKDLLIQEEPSDIGDFIALQNILTSGKRNVVIVLNGATMESRKPEQGLLTGLARTARSENEELRLVLLDTSSNGREEYITSIVMEILNQRVQEDELTERSGTVFIPRVEIDETLNSKWSHRSFPSAKPQLFNQDHPLSLTVGKIGSLDTLIFDDDLDILLSTLSKNEVEIKVQASGISSNDIAAVKGTANKRKLGDVCAGVVIRVGEHVDFTVLQPGDRVVAVRPGQGAHRTIVRNPACWTYKLKDNMEFSTAAAIASPLLTGYYAFHEIAHLRAGETVLIHSVTSQVIQMAVQVARQAGATVLVSSSSESESIFLQQACSLEARCIFPSEDTSFVQQVLDATNGTGIDVVLTGDSGKFVAEILPILAAGGRILNLGANNILESVSMVDLFSKNITLAPVNIASLFEDQSTYGANVMKDCWELASSGAVGLLGKVMVFPYSDYVKGFQMSQSGGIHDMVVLESTGKDIVQVLPKTYHQVPLFNPNKTHLLVGGLGGLGRALAEFLVRRGAQSLAFLSRSGADRPEAQVTLDWLQTRGVQTSVYRGDVTDLCVVQSCVDEIGSSLAGVFHAAVVLDDSPYNAMTFNQWQRCLKPKVQGALNLHRATLERQLDYFVCFSSVSAIFGGKGLANYAAANCYLDALMRHRRQMGLAGTAIDAGMVVGIGLVSENSGLQQTMERMGFDPVTEHELMYQIEEAVIQGQPALVEPFSENGIDLTSTITGLKLSRDVFWSERPLFRNLYNNYEFGDNASMGGVVKDLSAHIRSKSNLDERRAILTEAFIQKISSVLGVAADAITPINALSAYGLDSIVAVDFRKWFTKDVKVDISVFDILGAASISSLLSKALQVVSAEGDTA